MSVEFVCEILTEKDAAAAIKLAQDHFALDEPTFQAHGVPANETGPLFEGMVRSVLPQGLSVIAKDTKTGEVVGHRFAADWATTPGPPPFPPGKCDSITAMWKKAHALWLAKRGEIKPGQWVHFLGVGVHPDWRSKGLATVMYEHCIQNARSKGFRGFIAENASQFSYLAVKKLGFTEQVAISYADFEYNGTHPLSNVKPPHVAFRIMDKWFDD